MSANGEPLVYQAELAEVAGLRPHELNYRVHPEDQRRHLVQSIAEHGVYRNVVVAQDGTILAGHGVVEAALEAGLERVPVVRLDVGPDDPRALKILTGDNEISRLAEIDDRALTELLKQIQATDLNGLLGTGFDEAMLANLIFVTRPREEIAGHDDAAAWLGLPFYETSETLIQAIVTFESEQEREELVKLLGITSVHRRRVGPWSFRWPPEERQDVQALRFAAGGEE